MGVGKSTFAFSNSNITINGGSTTINITRDNQSYSHKLLHGYGEIATLSVGTTDYTWAPTASDLASFFSEIPNQKTRLIDVYLDTYNGSTFVGRDIHALTVTISEATGKPNISGFSVSDNNPETNSWGFIAYGPSEIVATQTATPRYGSGISKIVYTYGENETTRIGELIGRYLPLTTTPTDFTIGCKVVDSRGFSNTATLTKKCAICKNPIINSIEIVRCDADGNETESGTKAKATIKGSWTYFDGKNPAVLQVGYKSSSEENYTYESIVVSNGSVDVNQILTATFDAATDYVFVISLSDSFYSDERTDIYFANIKNIMSVSEDGTELTFDAEVINIGSRTNAEINLAGGRGKIQCNSLSEIETLSMSAGSSRIDFQRTNDGEAGYEDIYMYTNTDYGNTGHVRVRDGSIDATGDINADGRLTYGIPVLNSGNCNAITTNGVVYLGNGSTNRPVNKNGWLESMWYSNNYCHQTYTTDTFERHERMMQGGTWTSWHDIPNYSGTFTGQIKFDVSPMVKYNGAYRLLPYCRTNGVSFEWVVTPYAALKIYVDSTLVATLRMGTST